MSLVDSKAAFEQRCQDIGHTNGIDAFAGLAYACGTPQEKVPDPVFDQFAEKVAGPNPSMGLKSQLRRLMFESSTYVIAQLKQAVTADETPKTHKDLAKVIRLEDSKLTTGPHEGPQADFASPLKFQWCMQRRGLAFDQSGLVS